MSYAQHAIAEPDFRNRRARHIVYGHTHEHEIVALDASHADGYVLNQVYFNAGTWRRCHRQTQTLTGIHELVACDSFSLLAFYQGDERNGRSYETWCGTLAPAPLDLATEKAAPASAGSAAVALRGPQFAGGRVAMAHGY